MKLSEMFRQSVRNWLAPRGIAAAEVTGWDERTERRGMCDTCGYDATVVDISYRTASGSYGTYRYEGSFSDLLEELLVAEEPS